MGTNASVRVADGGEGCWGPTRLCVALLEVRAHGDRGAQGYPAGSPGSSICPSSFTAGASWCTLSTPGVPYTPASIRSPPRKASPSRCVPLLFFAIATWSALFCNCHVEPNARAAVAQLHNTCVCAAPVHSLREIAS